MAPLAPLLLAIEAPPLGKATPTTIDLPSASDPPANDETSFNEVGNDDGVEEDEEVVNDVNNLVTNLNTSVDLLHWADQETLHATSFLWGQLDS